MKEWVFSFMISMDLNQAFRIEVIPIILIKAL